MENCTAVNPREERGERKSEVATELGGLAVRCNLSTALYFDSTN